MSRTISVEELAEHLRERLEDVRNGESLRVVDGTTTLATMEPPPNRRATVIRHDPALRLQDFVPGKTISGTESVEWLIGERERERSGEKYRS